MRSSCPCRLHRRPCDGAGLEAADRLHSLRIFAGKRLRPDEYVISADDFGQHYRTIAQPFEWTFTRAKLDAVIQKITRDEPPPLALAA